MTMRCHGPTEEIRDSRWTQPKGQSSDIRDSLSDWRARAADLQVCCQLRANAGGELLEIRDLEELRLHCLPGRVVHLVLGFREHKREKGFGFREQTREKVLRFRAHKREKGLEFREHKRERRG